jgi:hypothetical protein
MGLQRLILFLCIHTCGLCSFAICQEPSPNKSGSDIQIKVDAGEIEGVSYLAVQGTEKLKYEFAG